MAGTTTDASADEDPPAFAAFLAAHQGVLLGCGLPPSLHRSLFAKLSGEVFDAGAAFGLEELPCGGRRRVLALRDLAAGEDVYLVDHAWSFRADEMRASLLAYPQLVRDRKAIPFPPAAVCGRRTA